MLSCCWVGHYGMEVCQGKEKLDKEWYLVHTIHSHVSTYRTHESTLGVVVRFIIGFAGRTSYDRFNIVQLHHNHPHA